MSSDSEFKRCLQALAQPAEVQRALFPEFAAVGDELALEFDDALRVFRAQFPNVRPEQTNAVDALDQYLEICSKNQTETFWCDNDQLGSAAEWQHLRTLAARALSTFGWDSDPPPPNGAVYVSKTETVRNT